jgi:hypothetical protein
MVGRELPNLRPNGEDHRGAGGGERKGMLRNTRYGEGIQGWRSSTPKTTTRIRRVLDFQ